MNRKVKSLITTMDSWLECDLTLKEIYDEVCAYLGLNDGSLIFYEFVKSHKEDKEFMKEFNKTSFMEQQLVA